MNRLPQGDWSTLVSLGRWLLTGWLGRVDRQSSERQEKFIATPENLADRMHDDGINWTEILLWVMSGIGTLLAFAFKAKLDGKMDKDQVDKLIDAAIDKYHERTIKLFREETLRMHEQNQARFEGIEEGNKEIARLLVLLLRKDTPP
jgi:hypothetical protein